MQVLKFENVDWYCIANGVETARINGINCWRDLETFFHDLSNVKQIVWEKTGLLEQFSKRFEVLQEFNDFSELKFLFAEYCI